MIVVAYGLWCEVLAHFDDDDLYSSSYLDVMCKRVLEAAGNRRSDGHLPAAAATMSDWHVLDVADSLSVYVAC
eukprot:2189221-Amphidinium_carterae.1